MTQCKLRGFGNLLSKATIQNIKTEHLHNASVLTRKFAGSPEWLTWRAKTDKTYVFFNNHYRGQSANNAMMFAAMLGLQLPLPGLSEQMTLGDEF